MDIKRQLLVSAKIKGDQMLSKVPEPGRGELGFKDAVEANFKFLASFGLRLVKEQVTLVRYESSEVFVNIYHGRSSYELGVEIGRLKEPGAKLSVFDAICWVGAEKVEGLGKHVMFQVSSREGVQEFVPKLAALVKKYAIPFLSDDRDAYRAALDVQAKRYLDEVKEGNLTIVRRKADAAWHAKDYAQVIETYAPMRNDLSDVEAKRLAYAERQVLTTGAPRKRTGVWHARSERPKNE